MKRRLRLSLRARLLTALLTVTAIFLIVLGLVASITFGKRLGSVFDASLSVASQRSIQDLSQYPDVYAVYYSLRTHSAGAITPSNAITQGMVSYLDQRVTALRDGSLHLRGERQREPFTITLPGGGPALRAVWRIYLRPGATQTIVPPGMAVILVAKPNNQRDGPLGSVIIAEILTGAALLVLLAACGPWLIRRSLAPLDQMATTANEITSRGDLTARMPDSGDHAETGRLSSAINTMLDRIQQAFNARLTSEQKVREFAADASHELRTPLTTIRGYAELYRQGALGPDRLPDAMRRIEQEANRMSRLVAELLELARLDRPSSLDLTETDLSLLVHDAVADAQAVEPDRPVYAEAPAHLLAVVDESRIRQVLANLLGNVRAYTPADTPTAVRLAATGPDAVLEVADSGPGMSAENAARAFDRFHRGGSNGDNTPGGHRNSNPAGSGLGLSIVQAIAQAHGGQATLESVPGRGTRVRIWLPLHPAAPRQDS
jgi:two-component system, OmpR family, sensor kinase